MLRDYVAADLSVIFCGTAAGTRSAAVGHYYAGRGNKFWRTIHEIGLTDRALQPEDDGDCLEFGFGFTDLAKGFAGMDNAIPTDAFDTNTVHSIVRRFNPSALAFNGKKAAQIALAENNLTYGLWKKMGTTGIWVLPSTSGAANAHWSIGPWYDMANSLNRE
jgi:double-stranded uracil-DNA glycosylase